jgi:SWI/SNF-related matrix-associated actin-dependent regulator of chromatin subfamily A member 5
MDFDVCITSYEVAIREKNFLRRIDWHFIVVDEAHRLKNEDSVLSQTLRLLPSQHRLLLTGTPLQNNLHELWALLNFLLPTLFDSAAEFDELFTVNAATGAASEIESDVLAKLHKILRPFLLRRLKTDVATDLPPKKETLLYVGMSEMQRTVYKQVLSKDFDALNGACKERGRLLNIVMQLRKCANHPYLFEGVEDRSLPAYGDHLVFNSGKLALLDKLLPRLAAQGSRVLLFSQMTRQLDILEDYCIYRNYKHCRIDGSTEGEARDQAVDAFNAPDSDVFMFLLSTRAGGLGLNLATADTVIIYDSDWNPQMDLQAQDRAHRIGQKRPVNVFRLIVENSIEEKIIERANMKLQLDALVIQQGRLAQGSMQLSKNEMMEMIRFGADQVFRATATTGVTDDDIEAILARGAARTAEMTEKIASMLGSSSKSNFANFSVSADDSEIAEKEAIERAEREEQERKEKLARDVEFMASLTDAMGKRERKMNTYDEKQYYRELFASSSNKRFALYRPRKLPPLYDYQFVDRDRVTYLSDLEMSFYLRHSGQNARPPPEGQIRGITEEEAKERDDLLEAGFVNWNRSDYLAYCRAVARYGRENSDSSGLLTAVPGKQADEVKRYHEAFWTNIDSLSDKERILRSVAKGDSVRQKNQEFAKLIEQELKQYTNPIQQMQITYTAMNKGKGGFTHAEDVFLLVETHQLGYIQFNISCSLCDVLNLLYLLFVYQQQLWRVAALAFLNSPFRIVSIRLLLQVAQRARAESSC